MPGHQHSRSARLGAPSAGRGKVVTTSGFLAIGPEKKILAHDLAAMAGPRAGANFAKKCRPVSTGPAYDDGSSPRGTTMPNPASIRRVVACCSALLFATLALSGCGAEVAAGATTVGTLQATQLKQAQARQAQVVDAMKAAQEAGAARSPDAVD